MTPFDIILTMWLGLMALALWNERTGTRRKLASRDDLQRRYKEWYETKFYLYDLRNESLTDRIAWLETQVKAMQEVDTKLVDSYLQTTVDLGKTRLLVRRGLEEMSK